MTIEETEGLLLTVSNENGSITKQLIPEIVEDSVPKVRSPWRRYFARNLDIFDYKDNGDAINLNMFGSLADPTRPSGKICKIMIL